MGTGVIKDIEVGKGFKDCCPATGYSVRDTGQRRCFSSVASD